MKTKIKRNAWGNWSGYEGTRKVMEFGTNGQRAQLWLADRDRFIRERQEGLDAAAVQSVAYRDATEPRSTTRSYEQMVAKLEAQGCTTSDAQAIVDGEDREDSTAKRRLWM